MMSSAFLVVVALMYFGIINIDQTRSGAIQTPKFEADVAKVRLGTETKTVAGSQANVFDWYADGAGVVRAGGAGGAFVRSCALRAMSAASKSMISCAGLLTSSRTALPSREIRADCARRAIGGFFSCPSRARASMPSATDWMLP